MTSATLESFMSFADAKTEFTLSESQQQLLPTQKDLRFFREHGWFITKKVISDAVIDRIFDATEELYAGDIDAELPFKNCSNWQQGDRVAVRNNEYISLQKKAFRQLSLQPIIGAIAAKLMNTHAVRYFQDRLISKEPNYGNLNTQVGWHTDRSYHSNCTSHKLLTVWIPLHDVTVEHGPLVVVDRSHLWSDTDRMRGFNHDNHSTIEQKFSDRGYEFKKLPIILQKGQISFHSSLLVHGSFQNCSKMMRRVVVMNLQDADNRYQTYWNNGRQIHHFLDPLCRRVNGLPDYRDPDVFPTIWSD